MSFKASLSRVCGLPAGGYWSQTIFSGDFIGVVTIKADEELVGAKGKELTSALEEVEVKKEEIRVTLTAIYLAGSVLYLVTNGGQVYLKREGKLGKILEKEPDGKLVGASGYLVDGDIVVLGSWAFGKLVRREGIEKAFVDGINEFGEILTPVVSDSKKGAEAVAVAVGFTEVVKRKVRKKEPDKEKKTEERIEIKELIKGRISGFLLRARVKVKSLKTKLFGREKKVDGYRIVVGERKKRTLATLVFIIGLLFLGSVFFTLQQKDKGKEVGYRTALVKVETTYEEGRELVDLNSIRAKTLLIEARDNLIKLEAKLENSNWEENKRVELAKKIEKELEKVGGVNKVKAKVYLDLGLLKKEIAGNDIISHGDRLIIWDSKNGSVIEIEKKSKKAGIIGGGKKVRGGNVFAYYEGRYYVLTDSRVMEGEERREKVKGALDTQDWGEVVSMVGYGGNLYLLDTEGEILKYVRLDDGFSEKSDYLASDVKPDFSKAVTMAIDGAVWVILESGELLKFIRGAPDFFSYTGFDGEIEGVVDFYTDDNLDNLYILDNGGNRVLVFDKKGVFLVEYQIENEVAAVGVVADEELKKIYLLGKDKVYEIKMKK